MNTNIAVRDKGFDMPEVGKSMFELCDRIRETSYALHRHLRHGHVEKVYENGLTSRLRKQSVHVVQQHPLNVFDEDQTLLGEFVSDLFIENILVVELKACRSLANEHVAQLIGYLRASRLEHGLLINFGSPVLEIRKFVVSRLV